MARGSARILDDDEEIDLATFMLDACGIDYSDFFEDERILTRENLEKNFKFLKKMTDIRYSRRAPYFVLGYFILITGAKMPEDLRQEILDATRWEYEEGRWYDKGAELERKIYLNDFREKIRKHVPGKKLHPIRLIYLNGKNDLYTKNRKHTIIGLKELQEARETGKIHYVKHVLLQGWGLKTIPEIIFDMKGLQSLCLEYNQLDKIPEDISNLASLKIICLSYNYFKDFPESITKLPLLEVVSINNNYISILPESINKLKLLKTLYIRKNKINKIPGYLGTEKFKIFYKFD
ncbi:MAG: leucine-rich repeat domain-containing protein [Candidatus Helarchaeota archaeon]|nr:leucine-rich repeat domain-containing protein [Candidatus Helarchaeota archaeon]